MPQIPDGTPRPPSRPKKGDSTRAFHIRRARRRFRLRRPDPATKPLPGSPHRGKKRGKNRPILNFTSDINDGRRMKSPPRARSARPEQRQITRRRGPRPARGRAEEREHALRKQRRRLLWERHGAIAPQAAQLRAYPT
jgi:hypothetical protein